MKSFTTLKRGLKASLFCFMALLTPVAAAIPASAAVSPKTTKTTKAKSVTKNSFSTPDFAYPQTVTKNAEKEFDRAIAHGDGATALKAALQLCVAGNLVSQDSVQTAIDRFEKVASTMQMPYGKLALILEAQLYSDIYSENRWVYDGRTLPLAPLPTSVFEWSRPMFQQKVEGLVKQAMTDASALAAMPVADIAGLLEMPKQAQALPGLSVFDFMTLQGLEALAPFDNETPVNDEIPFGDAVSSEAQLPLAMQLINGAIERHSADADQQTEAYFMSEKASNLVGDSRFKYLKSCVEHLIDTPYAAPLLSQYCQAMTQENTSAKSRNDVLRMRYDILRSYASKYPSAWNIADVLAQIESLTQVSAEVKFPSQVIPGREFEVTTAGANIYRPYLLIYKVTENDPVTEISYNGLHRGAKLLRSIPLTCEGSTPDHFENKVKVAGLEPGYYALVMAKDAKSGIITENSRANVSLLRVSDISTFVTSKDGKQTVHFVSAINGKPLAGAKVMLYKVTDGNKAATPVRKTADSLGAITIDKGNYRYVASYGDSRITGNIYSWTSNEGTPQRQYCADVLTSLSVYKPGQTAEFMGVVYTKLDKKLNICPDLAVQAVMLDANWQPVDTLDLTTDKFGRVNGEFTVPTSGLLGRYTIQLRHDNTPAGDASIQVAEYKSPTFFATTELGEGNYKAGDVLKFTGSAMTYAGMPVAGAKVAYTVNYQPCWWWRNSGNAAEYGGETETDGDGRFKISLPTSGLKNTRYAFGTYRIKVSVTNAAGETQEDPSLSFALGEAYHIQPEIPSQLQIAGDSVKLYVPVFNLAQAPVKKELTYTVKKDGKEITSGQFMSPMLRIASDLLPSGKYELSFKLRDEENGTLNAAEDEATAELTVFRASDRVPPVATPLWVTDYRIVAPKGAKSVKVKVGSSYDNSYIFAQICNSRVLLKSEFVKVSNGFVEIPVTVSTDDEQVFVNLFGERDLTMKQASVKIIPWEQDQKLKIETVTFRDRIDPGAKENWKFRFSYAGQPMPMIPVSAVMSNKALNAIQPFEWTLDPSSSLYWNPAAGVRLNGVWSASNSGWFDNDSKLPARKHFEVPSWQTWGYGLYSFPRMMKELKMARPMAVRGGARLYNSAAVSSSNDMLLAENAVDSDVIEEVATGAAPQEGDAGTNAGSKEQLREVDVPLAFFMPNLATDSQGIAEVDFTAPDFVGTWQLQVAGYTPQLKGSVLTLDAVASKRVMAQLNAPRFARTGDILTIAATLYNNSDTRAQLEGRMEILNPETGETVKTEKFAPRMIDPSGSWVVETSLPVPADVSALQVRVYAETFDATDGEQTVFPVLPSSTPVVEADPFYLQPGPGEFDIKLPKFAADAQVTLKYSDNPIWECVTALPAIVTPQSSNMLSQVYALYGNAVAQGLLKDYPQLIEGIKSMAAPENAQDSLLVSNLSKNQNLKTVTLNNTPWVNNAQSETARMQGLVDYADPEKSAATVASIMKTIRDKQNADGGWSWCPEMESSEFITGRVLLWFSMLKSMGYLPEGGEEMALKAFKFTDSELVKDWKRFKTFSPSTLLNYLYVKSAFPKAGNHEGFDRLESAAMKAIKSGWKKYDIYDKATAAMLMNRKGESKLSRSILESLRQYASVNAEKGMWFDNLRGSISGWNPLITTAQVLEAFAEIEPQSESIDKLRQYLLVCKQVQDWGDDRNTCEVIHAVLTSGSKWTDSSAPSVIMLNGKPLTPSHRAALTGAFTMNLDVKEASKARLTVEKKSAGPAWGGVVSQYVAPILDVKADKIPELSIVKQVLAVTPDGNGETASGGDYKLGDRIRVTLTIVADRDLDYVAVTDQRAACLEPAQQLSQYTSSDGVWFYQEVRDSQTNLFIPFLPKGTHVISYDCFADRTGTYSVGIATAQSQYEPLITAHTAGAEITVK